MKVYMLTTKDNPYNPFTNFEEWYRFDRDKGYYCSERLARIATTSNTLSDVENERFKEQAIDFLIENDFLGIYKKLEFDETMQNLDLDVA